MRRTPRPGPPAGTKRTLRIDLEYEGTNYVGWQRQAKGKSVQGILERALSRIADEKVTLFASSRTDAGVHARQQVASFSLKSSKTPVEAFVRGTNTLLPEDIRVCRAEEADLHFLASADVGEKTYRYFIQVGEPPNLFLRSYSWHIRQSLDLDAMKEAAEALVGTHDFSAFRGSNSQTRTSTRTVREVAWPVVPLSLLCFEITADGFLKYMVRNIVGTLVEIGRGKRAPGELRRILESGDRRQAGAAAPPHGLFLWRVSV